MNYCCSSFRCYGIHVRLTLSLLAEKSASNLNVLIGSCLAPINHPGGKGPRGPVSIEGSEFSPSCSGASARSHSASVRKARKL